MNLILLTCTKHRIQLNIKAHDCVSVAKKDTRHTICYITCSNNLCIYRAILTRHLCTKFPYYSVFIMISAKKFKSPISSLKHLADFYQIYVDIDTCDFTHQI